MNTHNINHSSGRNERLNESGGQHRRLLNRLFVSVACFLALPLAALAQLPTPTYGWNLGNTMEAPSGEGTWSPAATQQLISSVAAAGFNTIRIPVAWNHYADTRTL